MIFKNREHAGKILAGKLVEFAGQNDLVVLGLPRGGVPVAYEIARSLRVPLDVFVVRKLGFPGQPELAMGAIASGGVVILNRQMIEREYVPYEVVQQTIEAETDELNRREKAFMQGSVVHRSWKKVILVDDGLATGSTMGAAVSALHKSGCEELIVAVPVSARETFSLFRKHVDKVVCVQTPANFCSVGQWYEDFTQTSDEEVRRLLDLSRASFANHVA